MARHPSPFPEAAVARLPKPHEGKKSAVLVARDLGYLCLRVQFHGAPLIGVEVRLFEMGDDGKKGEAVGEPSTTDEAGIFVLDRLVPAGSYLCEVEEQPPIPVTTVRDPGDVFPVILPAGRPYSDLNEGHSYEHGDDEERST
jgi:hypothetical protein